MARPRGMKAWRGLVEFSQGNFFEEGTRFCELMYALQPNLALNKRTYKDSVVVFAYSDEYDVVLDFARAVSQIEFSTLITLKVDVNPNVM